MSNMTKRLDELEESQLELQPIYYWEGSPIPPNPEGKPVIVFGWAHSSEEATPDPSLTAN